MTNPRKISNQNKTTESLSLEDYLKLDYPVTLYPDSEEGGYVAEIKDLPGCLTQGDTLEEVIENINDARELWLETAYAANREIPLPHLRSRN